MVIFPEHICSTPSLQFLHFKQLSTMQPTPTWSPTLNLVTFAPIAETTPASSCPGTTGKVVVPQSLLAICTSVWQMPQYFRSNVTSSAPGRFLWIFNWLNLESLEDFPQASVSYKSAMYSRCCFLNSPLHNDKKCGLHSIYTNSFSANRTYTMTRGGRPTTTISSPNHIFSSEPPQNPRPSIIICFKWLILEDETIF